MKKTKMRILSRLLAIAMLLNLLPTVSLAAGTNNSTVTSAAATDVGATPPNWVGTIDISNDSSVMGTLDIDDLIATYPNLVAINVNSTNITDIIATTPAAQSVTVYSDNTFVSGSSSPRELVPQALGSLTYNLASNTAGIDLDDLVADLAVRNGAGTTAADLISGLEGMTIDGTPYTPAGGSVYGVIADTHLRTTLGVGTYNVELEFSFFHVGSTGGSLNWTQSVQYTLTVTDVRLEASPTTRTVYQGSSASFEVTFWDETNTQVTLAPTLNLTSTLALPGTIISQAASTQDNKAVTVTVDVDLAEPAGTYTVTIVDSVSGKDVDVTLVVQALSTVSGFAVKESNGGTVSATPFDPEQGTMYIRGGTSISSWNSSSALSVYTDSTVYLLYDVTTPLDSAFLGAITATDLSGNGVQGEIINVSGQAALRVTAPAQNGTPQTGTLRLTFSNSSPDVDIDYSILPAAAVSYAVFQIDAADLTGGAMSSTDVQALINDGTRQPFVRFNPAGNVTSPGTGSVLEETSSHFVVAAQFTSGGVFFPVPYASTNWYDGPASGSPLSTTASAFSGNSLVTGSIAGSQSGIAKALLVSAQLNSYGQDVGVSVQISDGGSSPPVLEFDIEFNQREVDRYEFYYSGTLTHAEGIAIGTKKIFEVRVVYNSGTVEVVDAVKAVALGLSISYFQDDTIVSSAWNGSAFEVQATPYGGENDQILGKTTDIILTDTTVKQGSVTITLTKSVITGLTYYVETPDTTIDGDMIVPYDGSVSSFAKRYDQDGLVALGGYLEIPRGMQAKVWLVPVFSNVEMYDPTVHNAGLSSNNKWMAYGVNYGSFSSTASGGGNGIIAPSWQSSDNNLLVSVTSERFDVGEATEAEFAISGGVVSNSENYSLADSISSLTATVGIKAAAPVVVALDVTAFEMDGTPIPDSVTAPGAPKIFERVGTRYVLTGGHLGDELLLRVKAIYSDGSNVDTIGLNTVNTYAGGTYFLPLNNFTNYNAAMGLTTPTVSDFASGTDAELSALYGYMMSTKPRSYFNAVNPGGGPANWLQGVGDPHTALANLAGQIVLHDTATSSGVGITSPAKNANNDVVPGYYSVKLSTVGTHTLNFSGTYTANESVGEKTMLLSAASSTFIEVQLNVGNPEIEAIYLAGGDNLVLDTDPGNPIIKDTYIFDMTGLVSGVNTTFYLYPLVLDSSYYGSSAYTGTLPTVLSTSSVSVSGINYMKADEWSDVGTFTTTNGTALDVTTETVTLPDGAEILRLKVKILPPSIAKGSTTGEIQFVVNDAVAAGNANLPNSYDVSQNVGSWIDPKTVAVYTEMEPVVQSIYLNSTGYTRIIGGGTANTNTITTDQEIYFDIGYTVSGSSQYRNLRSSEWPYPGVVNTGTNVLVVTPVGNTPNCPFNVESFGGALKFAPEMVGTYTFRLSTTNINGVLLPTQPQGEKIITFEVTPKNINQIIYYGETVAIDSILPVGADSLVETSNSLLDAAALATNNLVMNSNANGLAKVNVLNSAGTVIAIINVTLNKCNVVYSVVPAALTTPWYIFAPGQVVPVQWKVSYVQPFAGGSVTMVEFEDMLASEWPDTPVANFTFANSKITAGPYSGITTSTATVRNSTDITAVETLFLQINSNATAPSYSHQIHNDNTPAANDITGTTVNITQGQALTVYLYETNTTTNTSAYTANFTTTQGSAGVVQVINDNSGARITGLTAGTTTVTFHPLLGGTPVSLTVNVSAPVIPTYTISGNVYDANTFLGIGSANITVTPQLGSQISAVADGTGNYSVSGLVNGNYTVSATKTGYNGNSASVNVSGINRTQDLALTPVTAAAASMTLNSNAINVGETSTATVNATNMTAPLSYHWSSSHPGVATVVGSGNTATITGVGIGSATITCTVTDSASNSVTATAIIEVGMPNVTLSLGQSTIDEGATTSVSATAVRFSGPVTYSWSVSDSNVISLSGSSDSGKTVTGLNAGTATISVTVTGGGSSVTRTINITVQSVGGGGGGGGGGTTAQFAVSYNANGGTGSTSRSVASGGTHTVLTAAGAGISRTGYTLVGWNTSANGTGTDYEPGDKITVTANLTLYAQWEVAAPAEDLSLNKTDHTAYLSGYSDGTFRPNGSMTRAEVAQMLYNLLSDTSTGGSVSFSDVSSGAWYYQAVRTLAGKGVISGYSDGTFRPNSTITRAEFVTMLSKFESLSTGSISFSDVTSSHWAYSYIVSAAAKGWIGGYSDGTFRPNQNITRAEAARVINVMLGRAADKAVVDANPALNRFSDVTESHWAYYEILEATVTHDHSAAGGAETWTNAE